MGLCSLRQAEIHFQSSQPSKRNSALTETHRDHADPWEDLLPMKVMPLRLQPGDDLRLALECWIGRQEEQAGCVIHAVGTLPPDGAHLHIAIADNRGAVIGGHLCAGSLVRTTAELVIGLLPECRRTPAKRLPEPP